MRSVAIALAILISAVAYAQDAVFASPDGKYKIMMPDQIRGGSGTTSTSKGFGLNTTMVSAENGACRITVCKCDFTGGLNSSSLQSFFQAVREAFRVRSNSNHVDPAQRRSLGKLKGDFVAYHLGDVTLGLWLTDPKDSTCYIFTVTAKTDNYAKSESTYLSTFRDSPTKTH